MTRLSSLILPALIHAGSLATVLAALAYQYIGGLLPCILCLQQRVPHYVLIGFGLLMLVPTLFLFQRFRAYRVFYFASLTLIVGAAVFLAAKHVGVEYGWWQGPMNCGGAVEKMTSPDQLFALERPDCSKPLYIFPGITMATAHLLAVLPLLVLSLVGLYRNLFRA